MSTSKSIVCTLILLSCISIYINVVAAAPSALQEYTNSLRVGQQGAAINSLTDVTLIRKRRQFDLTVSADHDDKEDETEFALEAIANLWRSADGNTQVEGSAKLIHHANSLQSGNTRYQARLHIHHDYKKK